MAEKSPLHLDTTHKRAPCHSFSCAELGARVNRRVLELSAAAPVALTLQPPPYRAIANFSEANAAGMARYFRLRSTHRVPVCVMYGTCRLLLYLSFSLYLSHSRSLCQTDCLALSLFQAWIHICARICGAFGKSISLDESYTQTENACNTKMKGTRMLITFQVFYGQYFAIFYYKISA